MIESEARFGVRMGFLEFGFGLVRIIGMAFDWFCGSIDMIRRAVS